MVAHTADDIGPQDPTPGRSAAFGHLSFEGYSHAEEARHLRYLTPPMSGPPPMRTIRDAYIVPFCAGVYDADGHRIATSSPYHVDARATIAEGDQAKYRNMEIRVSPDLVDFGTHLADGPPKEMPKPTVFLGNYSVHYGHWLTDGMSRLWAERVRAPDTGRSFVPIAGAATLRERGYVADILDHMKLDGFTSARPKRLRRYDTLFLPEPAFQLRHCIYRNAADAHEFVASSLMTGTGRTSRPVYLSRSRLVDGMRSVIDESEVEAIFTARGFDVVHPETLTFGEQIALFNTAPMIAGFEGSAFHTGLFSLPHYRGTLLMLTGDVPVNGRLILQGAIKNYRSIFAKAYRFRDRIIEPDIDAIKRIVAGLAL